VDFLWWGCAAKWGASLLSSLVQDFPSASDPALIVGLAPFDDAAVYKISDDLAMVSTTDFFPPLVDHPSDFGAIAAANACSDVFAMGGRVTVAVNVAAFPEHFPREAIVAIFDAAAATVAEAGGAIAGGHTIRNPEPIFGLAVQGLVHPDRIFRKEGALVGDILMISKPLGTAIALAGGSDADKAEAIAGMRRLNRAASEALQAQGGAVHAVTDVTGFGLFGHSWEMAERAGAVFAYDYARLPMYSGVVDALARGVRFSPMRKWQSATTRKRRVGSSLRSVLRPRPIWLPLGLSLSAPSSRATLRSCCSNARWPPAAAKPPPATLSASCGRPVTRLWLASTRLVAVHGPVH